MRCFEKILKSKDVSVIRRAFMQINKEIDEACGRNSTFIENKTTLMENINYLSEGELRRRRRKIIDRMFVLEKNK